MIINYISEAIKNNWSISNNLNLETVYKDENGNQIDPSTGDGFKNWITAALKSQSFSATVKKHTKYSIFYK